MKKRSKIQSKNPEIARKLKELRPFVSFNYDLRKPLHPASAGKINRYYDKFLSYTNKPVSVYRPKKKKNLKIAKEALGQDFDKYKDFKVGFVAQINTDKPTKLKVSKGKVIIRTNGTIRKFFPFNQLKLASDTENEIQRVLDLLPDNGKYTIGAGLGEAFSMGIMEKDFIMDTILIMQNKYGNIEDFINGIYQYTFRSEKSELNFAKKLEEFRNAPVRRNR